MGKARYYADGFIPVSAPPAIRNYPCAASISVVKGDAIHDNGSGYATNATTAFDATFMGIAASSCDNSSGSAGAKDVEVYPPDMTTQYIVPVANNAVITQTCVGTLVDLEANDDIDISDTTITAGAYGFYIDAIDAGTEAVAANTYGYAIGHFQMAHA